jgi:hypothetical protein
MVWQHIVHKHDMLPLLLGFGKGCPYHGLQATGKTKKNYVIFVCVK